MRNVYKLFIVAAAFTLMAGCGNSSVGQPDSGGKDSDQNGRDSTEDTDKGTPTPDIPPITKECETDDDCINSKGPDYACNCDFECVLVPDFEEENGCREDKNCGSEKYCDPCGKVCRPLLPACGQCDYDEQCDGMMSRCVDSATVAGVTVSLPYKICAPWCPLSTKICAVADYPVGAYTCAEVGDPSNGVCIPTNLDCGQTPESCKSDADCPKGEKCYEDLRRCGCRDSLSCAFGEACHPITRTCIPGCTDDYECGAGKVCNAGLCSDACTGSLEDGNVFGCDDPVPMEGKQWDCVDGHCKVPGMCFSPLDCQEPETYCDASTKTCRPGCLIDYDCGTSAKVCDTPNKVCVERGCTGNWMCACGQVCNLELQKCETAEGKYCEPCVQKQSEDDPEPCEDPDILCIGFENPDTGEDLGSYCMPPCSADPENRCPQGWQCQDIKDSNGKSYGEKCVRFCFRKVQGGCAMGDAPDPADDTGGDNGEEPAVP